MPRISVVVPVFDVESYLAACLQSLARQSERDLEVVVVDDGATDGSRAIAERFAEHDPRFRVIAQPNGGLGSARNTGVAHATGEFLAFADGDDVVPDDAYRRLLGSLEQTGSDLATGNVQRLTRQGTAQAQFLARTFARPRTRTHITRRRTLLADRTAWNKLFRRSFWDAHGFRFPEGVVHEDIPVTLPAHLAADRVDVLAAPVYQWRLREDGAPSITQRRLEPRVLRDRLTAVEAVTDHFRLHGTGVLSHWYARSLVADDLRLHLDLLDEACAEYRALFFARVNRLIDRASPRIFAALPGDRPRQVAPGAGGARGGAGRAAARREGGRGGRPVRRRGRYRAGYGDARTATRLGRRDEDLALVASLDGVERDGRVVRLLGHAYVNALGAREPGAQELALVALPPGGLRAARLRLAARRLPTAPMRRGDLGPGRSWAGFEARLDPAALSAGRWDVFAAARAGGLRRRRGRFALASPALIGALDLGPDDGPAVRLVVTPEGALRVDVDPAWARIDARRLHDGSVVLEGAWRGAAPAGELRLRRRSDGLARAFPATVGDGTFRAAVPLAALREAPPSLEALATGTPGAHERWDLAFGGLALRLPAPLGEIEWTSAGHDVTLVRTRTGDAAIELRAVVARPVAPALAAPRRLSVPR